MAEEKLKDLIHDLDKKISILLVKVGITTDGVPSGNGILGGIEALKNTVKDLEKEHKELKEKEEEIFSGHQERFYARLDEIDENLIKITQQVNQSITPKKLWIWFVSFTAVLSTLLTIIFRLISLFGE